MTLADLFDNSKWETHTIAGAPKRGERVERRRYIGGGQAPSAATVAASTPTNEKESSIFGGLFKPRNNDVLGISPFSGPFESGEQYIGSDNVYRKGSMSYDVADPSRHHARFNPGGHTTTLRPVGTSEWGLGTLYNDAGETQARRLDHGRSRAAEAAAAPTMSDDPGILDKIIEALPTIDESKEFGSDVAGWIQENIIPAKPVTEKDAQKQWLEAQRNAGVSNPTGFPEYTGDPDEPLESTTLGGVLGHTLWDKLKFLKGLGAF
tara:strand:+ start:43 stop:834 length:792 start_codon:yes stop_codon:yes gene_type:complete